MSQNHRTGAARDHRVQPSAMCRKTSQTIRERWLSSLFLKTSRNGEPTTSLDRLFHCGTDLTVRTFFLTLCSQWMAGRYSGVLEIHPKGLMLQSMIKYPVSFSPLRKMPLYWPERMGGLEVVEVVQRNWLTNLQGTRKALCRNAQNPAENPWSHAQKALEGEPWSSLFPSLLVPKEVEATSPAVFPWTAFGSKTRKTEEAPTLPAAEGSRSLASQVCCEAKTHKFTHLIN